MSSRLSGADAKWFRNWVRSACKELEVTHRSLGDIPRCVSRNERWVDNALWQGRASRTGAKARPLGIRTAAELLDRVVEKIRYNRTRQRPQGRFRGIRLGPYLTPVHGEVLSRIPELIRELSNEGAKPALIVFRDEARLAAEAVLAKLDAIPGAPIVAQRNKARVVDALTAFFARYEDLWAWAETANWPDDLIRNELTSIIEAGGKASSSIVFRDVQVQDYQTPWRAPGV